MYTHVDYQEYDPFDVDIGIKFDSVIDIIPSDSVLWTLLSVIDTAWFICRRGGKLYSTRIDTPLTEYVGKTAKAMVG